MGNELQLVLAGEHRVCGCSLAEIQAQGREVAETDPAVAAYSNLDVEFVAPGFKGERTFFAWFIVFIGEQFTQRAGQFDIKDVIFREQRLGGGHADGYQQEKDEQGLQLEWHGQIL